MRGETDYVRLGADLPARAGARRSWMSTGKYVFPGIIDVHVHPVYLDDVEASSRVAAYGGTTTLLHFAYARTGDSLLQKVEEMLEDGRRAPGLILACMAACSRRRARCRKFRA